MLIGNGQVWIIAIAKRCATVSAADTYGAMMTLAGPCTDGLAFCSQFSSCSFRTLAGGRGERAEGLFQNWIAGAHHSAVLAVFAALTCFDIPTAGMCVSSDSFSAHDQEAGDQTQYKKNFENSKIESSIEILVISGASR